MRSQVKRLEKSLGGCGKAFSLLGRYLLQERENRRIAAQGHPNPPQHRHAKVGTQSDSSRRPGTPQDEPKVAFI